MPTPKHKLAPAPPRNDVSAARFVLAEEHHQHHHPHPVIPQTHHPLLAPKPPKPPVVPVSDLALPKSIITRLAKGVLPANTQLQANAILAMTKSATVFINYLAHAANEHTLSANKKTILPADVFKGLESIEFDFMRDRLEAEFAKFNEIQTSKRSTYRKKVAASKKTGTATPDGVGEASFMSMASTSYGEDGDQTNRSIPLGGVHESITAASTGGARAVKKARMDPSAGADGEEQDASDPESVEEDEEEDEDEDVVEEVDEEEQVDEQEEERDELEEKAVREEDEALDDDSD
ncbi:DNA polymerase epsilon subunit D [Podospora fimiseda]|uniref:DNA polymerase epsilon subunit D n=1 Tax=Podospora fimiseda TaxID=252190 RepID=A0AAN7BTV7_9PEZI|nr:DNA polymerase epsilon subunit D [Podospora fimiseda]